MTVSAYIDGASRGNPGESGIGVLLKDDTGNTIATISGYIGKATNNIAEYTALLACVKKASQLKCKKLVIHSDSELLAHQMNGLYKIKNDGIKKIHQQVMHILSKSTFNVEIKHIRREYNQDADSLANAGIDNKLFLKDV
jgi:ribonuclease HI